MAAIQRIAIDLALNRGYDNVTVDLICRASMISQRTFFNYFHSKEGVVLGPGFSRPPDEKVDEFIRSVRSDVVSDLIRLIAGPMAERGNDPELARARRRLILSTPALMERQLARFGEAEDGLSQLVLARFAAAGRTPETVPDLEDEARMVVALAASVFRYSRRGWSSGRFSGSPAEVLDQSIELIRRIIAESGAPPKEPDRPDDGATDREASLD